MTIPQANVPSKPSAQPPPLRPSGFCGRWVVVLLLQGNDNDAVRALLAADDLPSPSDIELDALRARYFPRGFKLRSAKGVALLEQLRVASFLPMTSDAERALALLRETPRARELVEAGLTVGVPSKAIAQTLQMQLKYEASPEVIGLYASVFFDTAAMSRGQLRVAVYERVRVGVMRTVADPDSDELIQRAIVADARVVATTLPGTPLAWSAVLISLGFSPGRRELADVIGEMESLAVVRAGESLLRGQPGDEHRAESFTNVLAKLHAIRETVVTPESQLAKQLTSFRVLHQVEPMRTVAQLRANGGEVTVDMGPPVVESGG